MKLPIYDVVIDLNDEETGMSCISLVDEPAVEKDFLLFDKQTPKQTLQFTIDDNMEHCITGVAIRADYPIYRIGTSGYEYYVRFSKETIKDIVEKYSKQGLWNVTSLQHDGKEIDGAIMVEMYIKDSEKGINPKGFEDIEEGSLFTTYKIVDEQLWEDIKNSDNINGFSIEIVSDLEPTEEYVEMNTEVEDWLMELLAWLEDEEDVEVIMSKDEKWLINGDGEYWLDEDGNKVPAKCPKCGSPVGVYIKGESVFLCSECGEYLGRVKFPDDLDFTGIKKNFKRVTTGDLEDIMKKNRKAVVTINDQPKTVQVNSLGTDASGKPIAVVYEPTSKDWTVVKVHDIQKVEMIEEECENVEYNAKWKQIVSDETININKTLAGMNPGKDSIDYVMDRNIYAMITYDDEQDNPHTGYRTCFVSSWGYTQKNGGGNECIRIFEYNGDTRSGFEDGRWRLLLTRRIREFKTVDYMSSILQAPAQYNGEAQAGTGKNGTMSSVKRTAIFPPKIVQ